jgi:hypothetical protein
MELEIMLISEISQAPKAKYRMCFAQMWNLDLK